MAIASIASFLATAEGTSGISGGNHICGYIAGDDASSADYGPSPDSHSLQNNAVCANENVVTDLNWPNRSATSYMRACCSRERMKVCICNDHVRSKENRFPDYHTLGSYDGAACYAALIPNFNFSITGER